MFGDDLQSLLPNYHVSSDKDRLTVALSQFMPEHRGKQIDYTNFYQHFPPDYFRQADLINDIRFADWEESNAKYNKAYTDAIIISNSCDITTTNPREINQKQCLMAPILDFEEYMFDLKARGYGSNQLTTFRDMVISQKCTNFFYLPKDSRSKKEFIALLDRIFWFPTKELNSLIETMEEDRITSLSHYGYYLFIFKLSYHTCRLPEQCDRQLETGSTHQPL